MFSTNGKWLAYTSREEGTDDVFIVPFPERGAKIKVTRGGGNMLGWGSGERLFFSGYDEHILETTVREAGPGITFTTPKPMFRIRGDDSFFVQSGTGFAASFDDRFLAMMAVEKPAEITTITLVVGWTEDMRAGK